MTVTVTKISPLNDRLTSHTPVVIEVTGTADLAYDLVFLVAGNTKIVAWDGTAWSAAFALHSVRTTLIAGKSYRYSILPNAGWTSSPEIEAIAEEGPSWSTLELPYETQTKSLNLVAGADRCLYLHPENTAFAFENTDPFSVLMRFKGTDTDAMPVAKRLQGGLVRGWNFQFDAGDIRFSLLSTDPNKLVANIDPVYADNAWHRVAFTKDNTKDISGVTMYWEGAPRALSSSINTLTTTTVYTDAPFTIGGRQQNPPSSGGDFPFTGYVCEVAIYNKKLSDAEVAAAHPAAMVDLKSLSSAASLIGWYRLGADPWPIIWDWSGNDNHLHPWNMAPSALVSDVPA